MSFRFITRSLALLAAVSLAVLAPAPMATPGDQLFFEDFESGVPAGWSLLTGTAGSWGVNDAFGFDAAYVAGDSEVRVVTPVVDLGGVPGARLTVTVIRGAQITSGGEVLSNRPDDDENFELDYLDDSGNWQTLVVHYGGGTSGESFSDVVDLPASALHAGFQLRFGTWGGDAWDGEPDDFWHFDNVTVIETDTAAGDLGDCTFGDDFENGLGAWSASGNATTGSATYNSASNSLYLPAGDSEVMSPVLDLSGVQASVTAWVRAGGWPGGTDKPESNDRLEFQYRRSNGSWTTFFSYCNGCSSNATRLDIDAGGVALLDIDLPAQARHGSARIRIRNTSGSSSATSDVWHVDNFCLSTVATVDHFALEHDGAAVNCQPEVVKLVAHAADHTVASNYTGTVALATSTAHGDWSLAVGEGSLNNAGNGGGSYAFATADNGSVLLRLANTFTETVNIDADDGSRTEAPAEDGDLDYRSSGFQFIDPANGLAAIATQIAGKPSDSAPSRPIELQAIRTDDATGACSAAFTGSIAIEIAMSCETPVSCAGTAGIVNGSSVATQDAGAIGAWTAINIDFGDNTDTTAALVLRYDDVGRVKLHARKTLSPSNETMSGSSNAFVVRPFGIALLADQGALSGANPGASDPSGDAFERAGDTFRVAARAVAWQFADDIDADGLPDGHIDSDPSNNADLSDNAATPNFARETAPDSVLLSATLIAPTGGNNPGLSGTNIFSGFIAGAAASNDLRWQETGVVEIHAALADDDYLGAGGVSGRSGHVGRFAAHHLTTIIDEHGCSDTPAFTYSQQALQRFRLRAHAQNGNISQNYDAGGFARDVGLSDAASSSPGSFDGGISKADFTNGTAQIEDDVTFSFSADVNAPYDLSVRAIDDDDASSMGYGEAETEIRSARLHLGRAAAPEYRDAYSALQVESWNGAEWATETEDACTSAGVGADDEISSASFSYLYLSGNLMSPDAQVHQLNLTLGEGRAAYATPGYGKNGSLRAVLDAPDWLEFDWNGDTLPEDPSNDVMFIDSRTDERMIWREEVVSN